MHVLCLLGGLEYRSSCQVLQLPLLAHPARLLLRGVKPLGEAGCHLLATATESEPS